MRWAGSGMNWAAQEHAQERNISSRAMDSMRALTLGLTGLLKTGRGSGPVGTNRARPVRASRRDRAGSAGSTG